MPLTILISLLLAAAPLPVQTFDIPPDTEIQTTESGLQYSVLHQGEGTVRAGVGDRVLIHFSGWVSDGTLITSTRSTGKPVEVGIGQQKIKGLNEGLQLLTEGGHVKLTIPPGLGYGDRARGKIPAGATLVYEVELLEITARVPDFTPLDETQSEVLPSGLRVQWLNKGEGTPRGDATVWVDYTYWDAMGETQFSTTMTPNPVVLAPESSPFPFMEEALALMGEGDGALFEVPPDLLFGDKKSGKLPPNSVTIWNIQIRRIFKKPEFPSTPMDQYEQTPAGLWYRMIKEGHGKSPTRLDRVRVHYTGWLEDGKQIGTTYKAGAAQPATFNMPDVIRGLAKGIEMSREGGIMELVVPAELAYGDEGKGRKIPGGATLKYIVELVQVY